jgi:hypothetical protein
VDADHLQRLRRHWFVEEGGRWWSTIQAAPAGWDARVQLERADLLDATA